MMTIACNELLREILDDRDLVPLVAIVFGCMTGMVAIGFGAIAGMSKTRAAEQTRRELAAYVAEGSVRPEDAIAMLNAGRSGCEMKDLKG